jgi:hypothetical protein
LPQGYTHSHFSLERRLAQQKDTNGLLREGSIVKLDSDPEGGPFYAPSDYVEPADRPDNSDLVLGRDYTGQ